MAARDGSDAPPERLVRHVFWKYPLISVILIVVVVVLAASVGSPNYRRDTIAGVSTADPGGAVLAFTQELDGTSSSAGNAKEFGLGPPAQVFVLDPLRAALPLLGPVSVPGLPRLKPARVRQAVASFAAASPAQQIAWASNYDKALGKIPMSTAGTGMAGPAMGAAVSPNIAKLGMLKGDFGPVPRMVETDLRLAQTGFLAQSLEASDPGHAGQRANIWLYDHPHMLNTAVAQGLTDDQWGMVKERGFNVGPWYLIVPSVFHVDFPGGTTGSGFVLWNLLFAAILLFFVPLVPGVRSLPRRLKLYRFIYRYPKPGELDQPSLHERHGATHGPPSQGD